VVLWVGGVHPLDATAIGLGSSKFRLNGNFKGVNDRRQTRRGVGFWWAPKGRETLSKCLVALLDRAPVPNLRDFFLSLADG
jgi:hypothetical protein